MTQGRDDVAMYVCMYVCMYVYIYIHIHTQRAFLFRMHLFTAQSRTPLG